MFHRQNLTPEYYRLFPRSPSLTLSPAGPTPPHHPRPRKLPRKRPPRLSPDRYRRTQRRQPPRPQLLSRHPSRFTPASRRVRHEREGLCGLGPTRGIFWYAGVFGGYGGVWGVVG